MRRFALIATIAVVAAIALATIAPMTGLGRATMVTAGRAPMATAGHGPMATAGLATLATRPKPITHAIAIEAVKFQPQSMTVKAGDVVVWTNKDPFPHTSTSSSAGFDSHAIAPGASWRYTATTRGEFSYVCTLHPTMTATLTVE